MTTILRLALLCALVILPSAARAAYVDQVLADNPVGYWRLDETSGTTATNLGSLGASANGVYTGGVTKNVAGAVTGDSAASFDGSSGYVLLPGIWGGTTAGTIEAWVRPDNGANGAFRAIVSSTDPNFGHFQLYSPTTDGASTGFYTGGFVTAPAVTPINQWRHVALVSDNSGTTVYVDGIVYSTGSGFAGTIATSADGQVAIARGYQGDRLFSGAIDEVAIYSTALSQARIQAHIASAVPEPGSLALLGLGIVGLLVVARRHR